MSLPVETIAGSALVITLAYTVFGLSGFGSSMTAVPLLAHMLPLRMVVPMMLLFDLLAGLIVGLKNRSAVDLKEVARMAPFLLAGMGLGVTVLMQAPERLLILVLGVFVLCYSGWSLLVRKQPKPMATRWAIPFGVGGGIFTALFGTGGPIYTIYLARRIHDARALRASISVLMVFTGFARLALFASAGLYRQDELLLLAAWLLPCAMLGLFVGSRLNRRLPGHRVVKIIWAILIVGGVSLVKRGLGF
jgi:uncharacterized membrane protein YfcA